MEESNKKKTEFRLTAVDRYDNVMQIFVHECPECSELVPKVGKCPSCGTAYAHKKTIEDFKTGYLHYIYECSCPGEMRKAQKVIKFTEVVDEARLNVRKNLVDDFLKSGGY
ncbi:MAG: hypothetical protein OIN88_05560 [Candidatus Methanoperedens sp.]|nr:hypothetical protein [Candidatus Methanoperedens sp.]MCZ7359834.1 hypothetical protein [Candidatus Methanoperedens sp.]HLB72001.1 hypothetical protein [Candidatus Methanoperedens sp.]